MRTATPALVLSLAVSLLVAEACKSDEETAVVADAEAPPAVDAAPPPPPPEPTLPATTPPTPPPPPTQPLRDAGKTDAGTVDAGKTDAGTADAGKTGGNVQACLAKCQAVLASCLTPQAGKDGGFPTFGDPTKCKAASDACQAACKP